MWLPLVSIILPAYNCEKYIAASVASILQQVYDNFELIVVNDGSADNTLAILSSIADKRLRVLNNDGNKGLIYSLNRAIDESKGEFIARMDADDVATNDRIEKQVHWLLHHPDTAAVGSHILMIDEHGKEKGNWPLDRKTATASAIRKTMPRENCLAHPTMMIRASILKQYKYSVFQKNIEDYDLWLRMLGDGLVIDKIPQALLNYRVHLNSITQDDLQKKNAFYKVYKCKKKYLAHSLRLRKLGIFQLKVAFFALVDLSIASVKEIKKYD